MSSGNHLKKGLGRLAEIAEKGQDYQMFVKRSGECSGLGNLDDSTNRFKVADSFSVKVRVVTKRQ